MTQTQHVILGYPSSGKTTFLAALWHLLDATTATSLTLERISGDMTYLNEIKNSWIKCQKAPRTLMSGEKMVEMNVRNRATDQTSILRLPDFSGETFERLVAERHCDPDLIESVNEATGILFFVNADRANDTMAITDHLYPDDEVEVEADNGEEARIEFEPRNVPEQVRIIDMLQLLQTSPFRPARRRLVIAVSAWDVIAHERIDPGKWIAREMPMLDQFLDNASSAYETRICGISAQGGQFEGDALERLLDETPSERVVCVWDGERGTDITLPLTWLGGDVTQ